jgi:hypothetical protein
MWGRASFRSRSLRRLCWFRCARRSKPWNDPQVSFEFIDPEPGAGESYYYLRVTQVDDQLAWSSPIWLGAK